MQVFSQAEQQAILDNFDLETAERRRAIEVEIEAGLGQLKRRLEREISRLARATTAAAGNNHNHSNGLTVAEFLGRFGGDAISVVKERNDEIRRRRNDEDDEDIERTIKKRKRFVDSQNNNNQNMHGVAAGAGAESPTKGRINNLVSSGANGRIASTTASPRALPKHAPGGVRIPSSSSRARISQQINSRTSNAATGNNNNFIYRARPSLMMTSGSSSSYPYNPRLPQTPQIRGGGSTFAKESINATAAKTARRMPRRNESIQAYSMNGSPLGILDLAVETGADQGGNPPSSSDAAGQEDNDDWEVLRHQRGLGQATNGGASTLSPLKSFKSKVAASAGASSSFKAAIVAGASKVKHNSSSSNSRGGGLFGGNGAMHPNNNNGSSTNDGRAFTFQAAHQPSPSKNKADWERWARSFTAEIENMSLDPQDRERLRRRMTEMMAN